jgi:hypothetical protein
MLELILSKKTSFDFDVSSSMIISFTTISFQESSEFSFIKINVFFSSTSKLLLRRFLRAFLRWSCMIKWFDRDLTRRFCSSRIRQISMCRVKSLFFCNRRSQCSHSSNDMITKHWLINDKAWIEIIEHEHVNYVTRKCWWKFSNNNAILISFRDLIVCYSIRGKKINRVLFDCLFSFLLCFIIFYFIISSLT